MRISFQAGEHLKVGGRDRVSDDLNLLRACGELVLASGTLEFITPVPAPMREAPEGYDAVSYS